MYGALLKQPNPIEAMTAFTNMSSSMTHNALMSTQNAIQQQQFRANKAMGPIMQQSVGEDGVVDYDKAVTLMAQDPATAYLAPEYMMKAFQGKQLQLQNKLSQLDITAKKQALYGNTAGSLLAKGDSVTRADVAGAMTSLAADMVAGGIWDDADKDRMITFLSQVPEKGSDINAQMKQVAQKSAGAADSINKVVGSFQTQNVGGQTILGYTNPINQQFIPIGSLTQTPTPAEMNAPVQSVGPDGTQTTTPRVDALPMYTGQGTQINAAPGAQPGMATPGAPPAQPGSAPAAAPQGVPAALVTKLGPETSEWLNALGHNIGAYSKQLNEDTQGIQSQLQMLQQMQDLSAQFKGGAGSSVKMKLAGLAQAVGMPKDTVDQIGLGNYAAAQAFEKYTVQNTMNVLRQAIGGQGRLTNLEFEQFLHSNPNLDTDPRAVQKILAFSQKLYKLKAAEQQGMQAWVKSGHAPSDFPAAWTAKLVERGILRTAKPTDASAEANWKYKEKAGN
jgi:hypothetical protein